MYKYKIGIIGTENSHAHHFIKAFNKPDENGNFRYPDCHVNLVYGHYKESNERAVSEFGADKIAESIEEMVNNVDAVMVTARDGKFHYEFVKPFIEAKIPAFIDKPFTVDVKEALDLIKLAEENKVPICGGSSLKFAEDIKFLKNKREENKDAIKGGTLAAPVDFYSQYSGVFFYSPHLTEMTLEVFGYNPKSIYAKETNGNITAIVSYDDFNVTNHFNNKTPHYFGAIYKADEIISKNIDISDCADAECDDFVNMLRSGKSSLSYRQLVFPVIYMNALKESYETKKEVEINCDIK